MKKLTKLADGLWHIQKFVDDNQWQDLKNKILSLPDSEYTQRHEPMRNRLEIQNPSDLFYLSLVKIASDSVLAVGNVTKNNNMRNPPGLFLWRDFHGYQSAWHPDDFTRMPTAQIYIDGDRSQGTSFIVDDKEIFIPFEPNTGYLMDNRYQIVHGMMTPVQDKVRQSIYLIY
jgi:hypothetical protein